LATDAGHRLKDKLEQERAVILIHI